MMAATPLAVTMGEPAGVGAELSLKAWLARRGAARPFFVLDDPGRLSALAHQLGLNVRVAEISRPEEAASTFGAALPVLPVRLTKPPTPGHPDVANAGATIEAIERATGEVRGALELSRGGGEEREGGSVSSQQQQLMTERERLGVAALRERLVSLQEQLAAATERLSTSRARLSHNEERLRSLKAAQEALEAALARKEEEEEAAGAEGAAGAAPTSSSHLPSSNLGIDRGSWVPLAFVAELDRKPGTMLPVEVGGVPWVLFRTAPRAAAAAAAASSSDGGDSGDDELEAVLGDDEGESRRTSSPIACLRDECAHRACPLSLGKVDAAGRAVCPYHGWAYDGLSGSCVEMPSTLHRRGVGVASMRVGVRDGVVWGWKREEDSSTASSSSSSPLPPSRPSRLLLPPLPATAATPEGFVVVAEAAVPNSPSPPGKVRDALARGGAALAARAPGSAAAKGLLPSSSSSSSPPAPVETVVIEEGGGGASAVVTLARGFGGRERNIGNSSTSLLPSPPPPPSPRPPPLLRLLHLVAPGRVGGSRLLLRVCVAEGAAAATAVFGSGKRRLWASLAEEAAEEDAKLGLGGGGGEGEDDNDDGGGVAAASSTARSVFRL